MSDSSTRGSFVPYFDNFILHFLIYFNYSRFSITSITGAKSHGNKTTSVVSQKTMAPDDDRNVVSIIISIITSNSKQVWDNTSKQVVLTITRLKNEIQK